MMTHSTRRAKPEETGNGNRPKGMISTDVRVRLIIKLKADGYKGASLERQWCAAHNT